MSGTSAARLGARLPPLAKADAAFSERYVCQRAIRAFSRSIGSLRARVLLNRKEYAIEKQKRYGVVSWRFGTKTTKYQKTTHRPMM